jgi:ATP-dependent Clp protease protease subunit
MGAILLAGGAEKKRIALPHSRIMIHQPMGGTQGQASDIEIYTREMMRTRDQLYNIIAKHTGKDLAEITKDSDRDKYMMVDEALEYGIIDTILTSKEKPASS